MKIIATILITFTVTWVGSFQLAHGDAAQSCWGVPPGS